MKPSPFAKYVELRKSSNRFVLCIFSEYIANETAYVLFRKGISSSKVEIVFHVGLRGRGVASSLWELGQSILTHGTRVE